MKTQQKVWLVTGVSGGLGRELAKKIYEEGDLLVGTVRSIEDKMLFEQDFPGRSKVIIADLADIQKIPAVAEESLDAFGRIDVLINNAGYGLFGLVEEVSEAELRHQLDVNFIAVWKLTQALLPSFRKQGSGHIIQMSSRVGISASPGGGLYAAGKFAVEGFSEALSQEVAPFGIYVTVVEPGPLRTRFFGQSVVFAANEITAYHSTAGNIREKSRQMDGNQSGSAAKVAAAIVAVSKLARPPFRLPFSQATIDTMEQKINDYRQVISEWKELAIGINH